MKMLLEQEEEWVKVSPEEYKELLSYASYNAKGISRIPRFRNKKIWITGTLTISNTPIESLDGIKYVEGSLDIANTKISDISGIEVKGHVWDFGTPMESKRKAIIKRAKLGEAQSRRESGEWDLSNEDIDEQGIVANAILQYLDQLTEKVRSSEESEELKVLEEKMEQLLEKEKQYEQEEKDLTDIQSEIEATEERISELADKIDVYNLAPSLYNWHGLYSFEVISNNSLNGQDYAGGTEGEVKDACKDSLSEQLDNPKTYFIESFLKNYIDVDEVVSYFEEYYNYDVYENPEVYFNDSDYELTDEQEQEIEMYRAQIQELEDRQTELEGEIENPDAYSKAWDDIQESIDDLQEKIDEIQPDTSHPTQQMVDDKVEEMLDDVRRNYERYMEDFGLDWSYYIDKEALIEGALESDPYGHFLGSYDGNDYTVSVRDEDYYVFRIS